MEYSLVKNNTEDMKDTFAPVIIVTLNRKNHLERCIKSLSNNKLAKYTDIYISVDYPPSEKYIQGYKAVCEYLSSTNDLDCFNNKIIYYQKENLGPTNNIRFLKEIVREKYDTYILSEDDNEFSPNFLEYINKGLDLFKENENIVSINAMKDTDWYAGNGDNIVLSKLFPAYGLGSWFDREDMIRSQINRVLLSPDQWKWNNIRSLFNRNKYIFALYINGVVCTDKGIFWQKDGALRVCDTTRSIFMYLTKYYCIVPTVSISRNWGNDGSGVNMPKNDKIDPMEKWKIDRADSFDFVSDKVEYYSENDKIAESFLIKAFGRKLIYISVLEYLLLFICGYDRNKVIYLRKRIIR